MRTSVPANLRMPIGRFALAAHDAACLIAIAAILVAGFPALAYAYVDPSVMTYTIQAIAGVAVALSALAGVMFRRSRRALMKFFKIDENAKKAKDPNWSRISGVSGNRYKDCGNERFSLAATSGKTAAAKKDQSSKTPVLRRIILAILVSAFLVITLFVIAPFEILAGNESSLIYGLADVWKPLLIRAAIILVPMIVILPILRGKAFDFALMLVFCVALGCYLQALFFNTGMPSTDGRPIDWGDFRINMLISTIMWIAVFVVFFVLYRKKKTIAQVCIGVLALALVIMQGVASASLLFEKLDERANMQPDAIPINMYQVTESGMYSVSPKNNVIVFVLDTYDTQDMIKLLEDDPEVSQRLQGFTWFKDSVGSMSPTRYGAPFLWTGIYPKSDEPLENFITRRYRESNFLSDVKNKDYSIGIYSDTIGDYALTDDERRELIYDKTINIKPPAEGKTYVNEPDTLKIMAKAALYRDTPWLLKPYFYFNTDQMNQAMVIRDEVVYNDAPYVMNDARWYESLKQQGLSFEEEPSEGAYRFIHLDGTHAPYTINANGEASGEFTSVEEQAHGSMEMVIYYLDQLKELGVYDDATIIITADHGEWWEWQLDGGLLVSSPLMLVKPASSSEGDLQTADNQVTAYDVLPTVIQATGGDASAYGPTLFEQPNTGRDRRYLFTYCLGDVDLLIVEYQINGNVLDESSWSLTGTEWDPSNTPRG